jgi:hypothetical protein
LEISGGYISSKKRHFCAKLKQKEQNCKKT